MPIYGITIYSSRGHVKDILSTSKSKIMKIAEREIKKGNKINHYQSGFTTLRIEGRFGVQVIEK